MRKWFPLVFILVACTATPRAAVLPESSHTNTIQTDDSFNDLINRASVQTKGRVHDVIAEVRKMTLMQEIVQGGCWDFLDTAWTNAGVPRNDRKIIYSDKIGGVYANLNMLQVGDWIYYLNHSYHNIEHSGMFIGWTDKSRNLGLILSYAGEQRQEPARYGEYDLSNVYQIIRAE